MLKYPGRLVYDTMQNPDHRPRMSPACGTLQTLTTGVSALWSTSFQRFVRVDLRIRLLQVSVDKEFSLE